MDAMQLAVVVGAGGMGAAVARTLAADYRILLVDYRRATVRRSGR